ncbi:MAG: hypothetical protein ACREK7_05865 [Gemmatimonadota bacterium]
MEHVGSTKPLPFQSGGDLLGILESRLFNGASPAAPLTRGRPAATPEQAGEGAPP